MNVLQEKIVSLKKDKKALVLAHYYQTMDIQEVADHVCDSFELARRACNASETLIVLCGVRFMAESVKILNPNKTVLLPAPDAGCPMADMVEPTDILALRQQFPEAAVVCYVNSSAAVKAVSDISCTSSSAVRIVRSLPQRQIIFVPDQNLGAYIATQVPEKEIILFPGFCPIHHHVTEQEILVAKAAHPEAMVLVHPECPQAVLAHADYVGSTAGIIETALAAKADAFIIGTEKEIAEHLRTKLPNKNVYMVNNHFTCPNMKKTRLADVLHSLETGTFEIELSPEEITAAATSLERMVSVS